MGALYRIVNEDPPRLANAGWLSPLLESTMTREPAARWSMAHVRDYLTAGPAARTPRPAVVPAPAPPPDPTRTDVLAPVPPVAQAEPPRRRATVPILVGLVVAILLGIVGWVLLSDGDPEADPAATGNGTGKSDRPSTSAPASPKPSPNAQDMESFISDYLATAVSDPQTSFGMLTPEFQAESGGIEGYRGFWDTIESADLQQVQADPRALTVAYTVDYTVDGPGNSTRQSTSDVNLTLVFEDGTYKIAAEG
jgi:hypothetical protein